LVRRQQLRKERLTIRRSAAAPSENEEPLAIERSRLTRQRRLQQGRNRMTTQTTFDFAALKRAIEERDAAAQLALYADHAEVRLVDRGNTPGSPRVLRGRDQIRQWIEDVCEREMSHRVETTVLGEDGVAFTEACRYPDGTNVLCATVLELRDGHIARQVAVQAWDE
jgi:ketosteroid isomerase-like protein